MGDLTEGLDKKLDMTYALLTQADDRGESKVAKVGHGPLSRPMRQRNERNRQHDAELPPEELSPLCLALFPHVLAGLENGGFDDRKHCNAAAFVKDGFEFMVTATLNGDIGPTEIFGSVSSITGSSTAGIGSTLSNQRAALEAQLAAPDLDPAAKAALEAGRTKVQAKMSACWNTADGRKRRKGVSNEPIAGERCPDSTHSELPPDERPRVTEKGRGLCWGCRHRSNISEMEATRKQKGAQKKGNRPEKK